MRAHVCPKLQKISIQSDQWIYRNESLGKTCAIQAIEAGTMIEDEVHVVERTYAYKNKLYRNDFHGSWFGFSFGFNNSPKPESTTQFGQWYTISRYEVPPEVRKYAGEKI
jgi:hypothetical protein